MFVKKYCQFQYIELLGLAVGMLADRVTRMELLAASR
jgi:hypothetical protein